MQVIDSITCDDRLSDPYARIKLRVNPILPIGKFRQTKCPEVGLKPRSNIPIENGPERKR